MLSTSAVELALRAWVGKGVFVGLYVNDVSKSDVKIGDFKEPPGYNKKILTQAAQWKIDRDAGQAIGPRTSFSFAGKAGSIVGYFLQTHDGEVIGYNALPEPVPIHTNEDRVHVRPRLRMKATTTAIEI